MAFQVTFSKRADRDFESILSYIEGEFGTIPALHFKDLIIEFASLIQYFPEIGSFENLDKQIRAHVIHRRLKVFYRIKKDNVIILRLFDTRQHPIKSA